MRFHVTLLRGVLAPSVHSLHTLVWLLTIGRAKKMSPSLSMTIRHGLYPFGKMMMFYLNTSRLVLVANLFAIISGLMFMNSYALHRICHKMLGGVLRRRLNHSTLPYKTPLSSSGIGLIDLTRNSSLIYKRSILSGVLETPCNHLPLC